MTKLSIRTIERRRMTSRYQGSSHVCMDKRTSASSNDGRKYGPPCCSWEQSCTGKSYMSFFFRLFFRPLQDHGFVEIQKFSTMVTWRNAAAAFLRLDSAKLRVQTTQDTRRCVSSPRSEVDINVFSLLILWNLRISTHSPFRREHWLLSLCRRNSFLPHSW